MRTTLGLATAAVLAATTLATTQLNGTAAAAPADTTGRAGAPAASGAAAALAALADHPGAARAADGQAFVARGTLTDADGSTHVRVDRTYRGLPVVGGDVVVHRGPQAGWRGATQTLAAPLTLATKPGVAATRAATRAVGGKAVASIAGLRTQGEPELVVDALGDRPRLAWAVRTAGRQDDGTPSRLTTYVDARTGAVIRRVEGIHTVDGQGRTLYSGTVPLQVSGSGSSYQLKDATRGGTYTTDVNNATDGSLCSVLGIGCKNGTTVTSTTTTFGTGANSNRASAAADAQYGTNMTWDYFKTTHGRNGIFGDGRGSYNRVHYGKNYVNAFWDGEKMTYGDGDGSSYGPLVSLDVAGHEMSHGVTENSAGLTYSGESGGLNEATSDIFGAMVEFHAANANDPGDYLIGEEFDLSRHLGLRRMDDPDSDGTSQNCWTTGTKNLDVHYSSGVGNHFFYLLAEGSGTRTIGGTTHSSTTCNGSTVTGIGRDAAARIWYRALTVYMTSGTTYAGARTATLNAAKDLFGATSSQYAAVGAAWSAVNVV